MFIHMPNEDSSDSPSFHTQSREPIDEELMFFDKAKQYCEINRIEAFPVLFQKEKLLFYAAAALRFISCSAFIHYFILRYFLLLNISLSTFSNPISEISSNIPSTSSLDIFMLFSFQSIHV